MTGTNHVLTGVVIGLSVQQPVVALPLALVSHFTLDALPHYGDPDHTSSRFMRLLIADGCIIALILSGLFLAQPAYWWLAILCGLVAASPDFMWLPNFFRDKYAGRERKPYTDPITKFHKNIQWAEKPHNWPYEFVWLGLMVAALFVILN